MLVRYYTKERERERERRPVSEVRKPEDQGHTFVNEMEWDGVSGVGAKAQFSLTSTVFANLEFLEDTKR